MIRRWLLAAFLLLLAALGRGQDTTDTLRIVTCAPSLAEYVHVVGAFDKVVGVSRFTEYPPEAKNLPAVTDVMSPGLEGIEALRPNLILCLQSNDRVAEYFKTRPGVKVVQFGEIETFMDAEEAIGDIAELCGRPPVLLEGFERLRLIHSPSTMERDAKIARRRAAAAEAEQRRRASLGQHSNDMTAQERRQQELQEHDERIRKIIRQRQEEARSRAQEQGMSLGDESLVEDSSTSVPIWQSAPSSPDAYENGEDPYDRRRRELAEHDARIREVIKTRQNQARARAAGAPSSRTEEARPFRTALLVLGGPELPSGGITAIGQGTYITELLEAAMGRNVLPASLGVYPPLNKEALLGLDPDVIIFFVEKIPSAAEIQRARASWAPLGALRALRNPEGFQFIADSRTMVPGPRALETLPSFERALRATSPQKLDDKEASPKVRPPVPGHSFPAGPTASPTPSGAP